MRNKKAIKFFGEKVINYVIAAIVLLLILGAGAKAYGLFQDKSEIKKAESNLNNFVVEFDNFMKGTENQKEFMILGPEDWYVLFYKSWDYRTDKCKEYDSCVCFCEGEDKEDCDKQGACSDLKYEWKWGNSYEINKIPFTIKIVK